MDLIFYLDNSEGEELLIEHDDFVFVRDLGICEHMSGREN